MQAIVPGILCGGSGTRRWPLSRECSSKQIVAFDDKPTLFARTLQRATELPDGGVPVVIGDAT